MIAEANLNTYMHQWGARTVPFHDGSEPFETGQLDEIRELLDQTAALRSVMLLSGQNGTGKSLVVAQWLKNLPQKAYAPLVITQATLSASAILATLVGKLGREPSMFRSRNLRQIEEAIPLLGQVTPVLVLDEAQNYPPSSLEEIRLLIGLNLAPRPLFALIMVGDNYLLDTLRLQSRRPLYSRIAIAYHMQPLDPKQAAAFLMHQLEQAGIMREAFDELALDMIVAAADGIPRSLNLIARAAWIQAAKGNQNIIRVEHVQHALKRIPIAQDKITTQQRP